MSATLRIVRTTSFPDTIRGYRVILDGRFIGSLRGGQELVVPLREERHSICVSIDWCGSKVETFDAQPGEEIVFECASALANWRLLFALVYILFLRDHYLLLRRKRPNQSSEPMRMSVTPRAEPRVAPATRMAHL